MSRLQVLYPDPFGGHASEPHVRMEEILTPTAEPLDLPQYDFELRGHANPLILFQIGSLVLELCLKEVWTTWWASPGFAH